MFYIYTKAKIYVGPIACGYNIVTFCHMYGYISCTNFVFKGACLKIFGKWIFVKVAGIVTFPTNI